MSSCRQQEMNAHLLITIPHARVRTSGDTHAGSLSLESISLPTASTSADSNVYLILKLGVFEAPVDPTRSITLAVNRDGRQEFTFHGMIVPDDLYDRGVVEEDVIVSFEFAPDSYMDMVEELDTFAGILEQYSPNFRRQNTFPGPALPQRPSDSKASNEVKRSEDDARGHVLVYDVNTNQYLGALPNISVHEDPTLQQRGHEGDPVVIELPPSYDETQEALDGRPREVFARAIPEGEHNWMTRGAQAASYVIESGTSLLLSGIAHASRYYIAHSTPARPTSSSATAQSGTGSPSSSTPSPAPTRFEKAVNYLAHERTRKGLQAAHSASGKAVKVSGRTVSVVEGLIKQAVGGSKGKQSVAANSDNFMPQLPPRQSVSSVPGHTTLDTNATPPAYTRTSSSSYLSPVVLEKPALPPRRSPSPAPSSSEKPPLPPRGSQIEGGASQAQGKLSTKERIVFSADLVLSTIDESMLRLWDGGTRNVESVVGHRYGPQTAESTSLLLHTGRNVMLVYVDMRGIGRRALIKKVGKEFIKGRVGSSGE